MPAGHDQHRQHHRDQRIPQRRRRPLAFSLRPAPRGAEGSRHRRIHRRRPQSHDPARDRARAGSCHLQGLQRLLVFRPPDHGRAAAGPARRQQKMPAGLGHHDAGTQGGMAARPQGNVLSLWQDLRPDDRRTGLAKRRRQERTALSRSADICTRRQTASRSQPWSASANSRNPASGR